jgi:Protein of Unknown function (DUF2784)
MGYELLNIFFFIFHSFIVLLNTFGWIFRTTRKWNLISLLLTGGSWFILGIWYGWGYCVCTHWHWIVRQKLGYRDESNNYIHLLIYKTTGLNIPEGPLEKLILVIFLVSVVMSISLNLRDYMRKKKTVMLK